jgi:hypothetical protein
VLAKTLCISPMTFVDVGEVLGLFYVLQRLQDIQMDNVDFVVDSKTTTYTFNSQQTNVTKFGQIIAACQSMLSSDFVNSRVFFNSRQTNVVAHAFTSEATLSASPNIYLEVPHCITNVVIIFYLKKKRL